MLATADTLAPAIPRPLDLDSMLLEYRIVDVLGTGAFGVTYRAEDTHLGLEVAIKEFFPSELAIRREDGRVAVRNEQSEPYFDWSRRRFLDEAKVLARFRHPNIVRVNRYFTANDTAYFVMDYEEGESLQARLRRDQSVLDERTLEALFAPVLGGLAAVHDRHYLHRDIKPGNIYLRRDDTPALLDFGAARLEMYCGEADVGNVLTHGYAPPEQYVADGNQGPWSDLYAVGATLYRCLAGRTPVNAQERLSAVAEGFVDPLRPAQELDPEHRPTPFLRSVDRMMELDPDLRPQSVAEVLEEWSGIRPSRPTSAEHARRGFVYLPKQAVRSSKVLVAGPLGVGKSTAVKVLSDAPTETRSAADWASSSSSGARAPSSVALDYGQLLVSPGERVHLYGMPGGERVDFLWEIMRNDIVGVLLLLDNARPRPLEDLDSYLDVFLASFGDTPVAIGVNRLERCPLPDLDDYHRHMQARHPRFAGVTPILEVDPRFRHDLEQLLLALLFTRDPGMRDYDG